MFNKTIKRLVAALLGLSLLAGCSQEVTERPAPVPASDGTYTTMTTSSLDQFRLPTSGDTVVTLSTTMGDIQLLMFPEAAPKAVENFVTHGQNGYYDGVIFHRVIDDFMIQGGDPEGTGRGGQSIWGTPFEDEFDPAYFPYRGTLAMANAGPATNGSQFFIVQTPSVREQFVESMEDQKVDENIVTAYKQLGGTPHLFGAHTVFGNVVGGMEVVDAIAAAEKDSKDKPLEDIVIKSFTVTVIE